MGRLIIGIDVGGTDCKYALVDDQGNILRRAKYPTRVELGPEAVLDLIAQHAREVFGNDQVDVIGVGVPGPMSSSEGIVYEAPNLGWVNLHVQKMLEDRIGQRVVLNNDANAAGYGEFWVGAGREVDNMILFTLGTGIGGAIILNGELYSGPDDTAGELGHTIIDFDGRVCGCGRKGCLEAYASATAIRKIVLEAVKAGRETMIEIPESAEEEFGVKAVYDAAIKGDPFALEVFDQIGFALGIGAANVINTFNPEMIAYSGAMVNAGELIFRPLRETARINSFAKPFSRVQIGIAKLGPDAGVIGAAGLALRRLQAKK